MFDNLREQGLDPKQVPYVIQYNKRDLPNAVPLDQLRAALNKDGVPDFEACAAKGEGVFETLKGIARLVLKKLQEGSGAR
jgi:signal recognition particle receptor subunit beta